VAHGATNLQSKGWTIAQRSVGVGNLKLD